jgi:hypothetical protein
MTTPYGYLAPGAPIGRVRMSPGQTTAGAPVGIVHIDQVWYPLVPGNVVNAWTYDFPVRFKAVRGLDIPSLFGPDAVDVSGPVVEACRELEAEGVRAIAGACGFFGRYQGVVREAVGVPVALSSLVQLPWVRAVVGPGTIGVLTADSGSLDGELLAACGVGDASGLAIAGLQDAPEFSAVLQGRGEFDNEVVRDEVVAAALGLCRDHDIAALVLECSDLPPYAAAVQAAVGKPVFDFVTLIRWLAHGVGQRPYGGFV